MSIISNSFLSLIVFSFYLAFAGTLARNEKGVAATFDWSCWLMISLGAECGYWLDLFLE